MIPKSHCVGWGGAGGGGGVFPVVPVLRMSFEYLRFVVEKFTVEEIKNKSVVFPK